MSKRFQECNWAEKLWRYRFYILIPFKWAYYNWVKNFTVIDVETNSPETPVPYETLTLKGKELWGILIGDAQLKMNWIWTSDEVFSRIKDKPKQR
jgi:hypothetical protein